MPSVPGKAGPLAGHYSQTLGELTGERKFHEVTREDTNGGESAFLFEHATLAQPGIVLLAHGGRVQTWNEEVRHVADQVDLVIPTEVAFGMATRRTMQEAMDRLAARGVTEIIAVPLFISSHSSVIESMRYLLGLQKTMPRDLTTFARMDHASAAHSASNQSKPEHSDVSAIKPLTASVPVRMTCALDPSSDRQQYSLGSRGRHKQPSQA
jgi:hypothetical protein